MQRSAAMRQTAAAPRRFKFFGVGERQVRVIVSDATPDRCGDVIEPGGIRLANFRLNPVVLREHDVNAPIARCTEIGLQNGIQGGDQLMALVEFPPAGTSKRGDETLALLKAGVLSAVSIGFLVIKGEPIPGGFRYFDTEMLEFSVVSIPANPAALVVERAWRGVEHRVTHGTGNVAVQLARARKIAARVRPPGSPAARASDLAKARAITARIRGSEPDAAEAFLAQEESRRREKAAGALRVLAAAQW
jgi:HK97 family phage prohead protease